MSLLRRLRNFSRLTPSERALALRAIGLLIAARVILPLVAFPRVRRLTERVSGTRGVRDDAEYARAVRRAVARAAEIVPGARCLAQALTAEVLLRRAGLPARTSIGVARDGHPLMAHAWVESGEVTVCGDATDLERYQRLLTFGASGSLADGGD